MFFPDELFYFLRHGQPKSSTQLNISSKDSTKLLSFKCAFTNYHVVIVYIYVTCERDSRTQKVTSFRVVGNTICLSSFFDNDTYQVAKECDLNLTPLLDNIQVSPYRPIKYHNFMKCMCRECLTTFKQINCNQLYVSHLFIIFMII